MLSQVNSGLGVKAPGPTFWRGDMRDGEGRHPLAYARGSVLEFSHRPGNR